MSFSWWVESGLPLSNKGESAVDTYNAEDSKHIMLSEKPDLKGYKPHDFVI